MEKYKLEYEVVNQYDPKNKELVDKYDVHGIPFTVFVDNSGNEIHSILGNMVEELADRDIKHFVDNAD
jgi:thioredoxin-related protein